MKKSVFSGLLCLILAFMIPAISLADVIGTVTIANSESTKVRAQSSADSEQISLVHPGEHYDCAGVAENGWYEILLPDGNTGFVSNRLAVLREGEQSKWTFSYPVGTVEIPEGTSVRARSGGSNDYAYLGDLPSGTYPCVGVALSGWYAIWMPKGWIGYIPDDAATLQADRYISPNRTPQSAILFEVNVMGIVIVTSENGVRIRSDGYANAPEIGSARAGNIYLYVGHADRSDWHGILLDDGQIGYVSPLLTEVVRK